MNKYLIIGFLSLVFSVSIVVAATTDFTADSDVTVSSVTFGASTADMLILNSSTAESWSYDVGTFTVTNPGTFNVGSGSGESTVKTIRMTQGGSTVACALNTTPATSYVTAPTAAATYTVVPSALTTCQDVCTSVSNAATLNSYPTCGVATCDSGYNLSGSGATATCVIASSSSGGSGVKGRVAYLLAIGDRVTAEELMRQWPNLFPDQVVSATPIAPIISIDTPTTIPARQPSIFIRNLTIGSTGDDVRQLQQFLNANGFLIAGAGVGSLGQETTYFGNLAKQAVGKFQLKYGIVATSGEAGFGIFGPKTRAKINALGKLELLQSLMTQLVQSLEQLRQLRGYQQ